MEVVEQLSAECYLVSYFLLQEDYIHAVCCWGDVLDFAWNGVEQSPWDDYIEVKKPFRKKYPHIAQAFGQKTDSRGELLPEPYITTVGFDHQPKKWWINYKIYGLDFSELALYGPQSAEEYTVALGYFRKMSIRFFHEIMNSDAKKPKALMKEYFGLDSLPVDE